MIKIEAWSDINCPYCYIGKRLLERALEKFSDKSVRVEWKSFELDPQDREWAMDMNSKITEMARTGGIDFHLEKAVPANSFNAHRLLHMAKVNGVQDVMNERLLSAKFVEGKDIDDPVVLADLGQEIGLERNEVLAVIKGDKYAEEVREDERHAMRMGINAVPFFVINDVYALSGAQPMETFLEVLNQIKDETRSSRF